MSYRHTLEAALESLHEIEDLLKGFSESEKIPEIEIDLTLQKLRNLYELMLAIKKPQEAFAAVATAVTTTVAATVKNTETQKTTKTLTDEHVTVTDIPVTTRIPANSASPIVVPANTAAVTSTKTTRETQTLSDQFKSPTTLHESLHEAFSKDGDLLRHSKPVSDLMTAIGINDRFTFVRELFGNDAQAFETTIKNLNDAQSFNDAYNFMIQHFEWDMDSETVQMLLDIVRRKFIKGRHE